jgi:hypothetical protein
VPGLGSVACYSCPSPTRPATHHEVLPAPEQRELTLLGIEAHQRPDDVLHAGVPVARVQGPVALKLRSDLIEGMETRSYFPSSVWNWQFMAKTMKNRSGRASERANASGSLRKRK